MALKLDMYINKKLKRFYSRPGQRGRRLGGRDQKEVDFYFFNYLKKFKKNYLWNNFQNNY
jgi:hypothetical protein